MNVTVHRWRKIATGFKTKRIDRFSVQLVTKLRVCGSVSTARNQIVDLTATPVMNSNLSISERRATTDADLKDAFLLICRYERIAKGRSSKRSAAGIITTKNEAMTDGL